MTFTHLGMAHDAGGKGRALHARHTHVGELLILIGQLTFFDDPVTSGPFHPLGKVTPIVVSHRTFASVRTRGDDMGTLG